MQHRVQRLANLIASLAPIDTAHQQRVVVCVNVPDVSDDCQRDRVRIEFPSGSRTTDSAAASFGGVLGDLMSLVRGALRKQFQNRRRHLFDESLVENDSLPRRDFTSSGSQVSVGDALVLGLRQSFVRYQQSLSLIALSRAIELHHDHGQRTVLLGSPSQRRVPRRQEDQVIQVRA